ncbi:CrcB-like protein [Apiospora kogelbergensis]|uniref:CrcB-like protein n=1 Tax=Apiospora kogelbergensis TaxID=1337665 RepID=UPI00312DA15B
MTQPQDPSEVSSLHCTTTSQRTTHGNNALGKGGAEPDPGDAAKSASSSPGIAVSGQHGKPRPRTSMQDNGVASASAKPAPEAEGHQHAGAKTEHPRAPEPSPGQTKKHPRPSATSNFDYDVPESYVNVAESSALGPIQNRDDAESYRHQSFLEEERSQDQRYSRDQQRRRRDSKSKVDNGSSNKEHPQVYQVSRLATQLYTISYLILFSIVGTLARLGLQALTYYPGAPLATSVVWPNFAGCIVMGFLSEDRKLFLNEWGTPHYHQKVDQAKKAREGQESGNSSSERPQVDLAAAKKAHMATKKSIPLYIGLATGFCGSFTSFSSFIRDVFLALSNDLTTPNGGNVTSPRNGGFSFMALLAVIITTVSLSISGLLFGAHLAICLESVMPSLPFITTRKVVDRICVPLAWGCWLGAVFLSIFPPDRSSHSGKSETWRGRATFALVFAPLGCLGRFYTSMYLNGRIASFPLGTFAVNILGTAVLGMAWDLAHVPSGGHRLPSAPGHRGWVLVIVGLAFMVAIMGGLRWSHGFAGLVCLH